jgi:diacylglycerol kinase family enzyme
MASAGVDSSIVHYMNFRAGLKKGIGPWAFAWEGLRHFWTYRFPQIEVITGEGTEYLGYSVVIGKSKGYGGWFSITRDARAAAPDFQVAVCVSRNRVLYFWYLLLALTGQLHRSGDYRFFRTTRLQVRSPQRVRLQIDGDSAGELPREFCVDGATVQILCPGAKTGN